MPTTRRRHVITETDEIAQLLDDAADRWPEDRGDRKRLLLRLVTQGHEAALAEQDLKLAERRRAIADTSGALSGIYDAGYLEALRSEWPK